MAMRLLVMVPAAAAVVAGLGLALCAAAGWDAHVREMIAAGAVTLASALLGLLPVWLARNSNQATVSQAGLAGTVVHMMLALVLAAVLWVTHVVTDMNALALWLMAFYWAQLAVLVVIMVATIRRTRPAAAAGSPAAA